MKRDLIIGGAILVILGSLLPAVTWTERFQYGSSQFREDIRTGSAFFNIAPALLIMLLLLLKWKSRAVITLVVAVIAAICSPLLSVWLYSNTIQLAEALIGEMIVGGVSPTNMALSFGSFVVAIGYLLVIIGSIRDIIVQRRPKVEA